MLGDLGQALHFGLGIGGRIDVHLLAEFLMAHNGLMLAARRGAIEIVAHHREHGGHSEGLGGEEHLAAGFLAHALGCLQVRPEASNVEDEAWGGDIFGQRYRGHIVGLMQVERSP